MSFLQGSASAWNGTPWGSMQSSRPTSDFARGSGGIAGHLTELGLWKGVVEDKYYGSEEETQGLLGFAEKSFRKAGSKLGGHMGAAMQVATISRERWLAFGILIATSCVLMAMAATSLPLIVLAPHHFAFVFTMGSACFLLSFAALKGLGDLTAHLMSRERRALSLSYVGSMIGTLWASMWLRSFILTLIFSGVQIVQLLWFFTAYIPGGHTVLGSVCDVLKSACKGFCLSNCLPGSRKGSSLPL